MKLKFFIRAVLFVFLTLLFAVYIAPADKILSLIKLPPDVKLYHVSGDVWHGQVTAAEVNSFRVRNIEWHLTPLTLFFIKGANVTVNDDALGRGSLGIDLLNISKRISLSDVNLSSSLDKLYPIFKEKLPFPLNVSGKVKANFSEAQLSSRGSFLNANGEIKGQEVTVDHPFEPGTKIVLGDVVIKVKGNASELKLNIEQNSEQFEFTGSLVLKNMADMTLDGSLTPKGGMPDSLQTLLPMLGKADANGKIKIHYTENLK